MKGGVMSGRGMVTEGGNGVLGQGRVNEVPGEGVWKVQGHC